MTGFRTALKYDRYNRPQNLYPCQSAPEPPGPINEAIEEVSGTIDKLLYNTGTENGFILVKETI